MKKKEDEVDLEEVKVFSKEESLLKDELERIDQALQVAESSITQGNILKDIYQRELQRLEDQE